MENKQQLTVDHVTVDYFIEKFTNIPGRKWFAGAYHNETNTRLCVLGHCGRRTTNNYAPTGESIVLTQIFEANLGAYPEHVNDGLDINGRKSYSKYGKTPRMRVLNALREIRTNLAKQEEKKA